MGSSTTDIRQPIKKEHRKTVTQLAFTYKNFSISQIEKESGLPSNLVEQILQDLCNQDLLKYVLGEYQLTGQAENRFN